MTNSKKSRFLGAKAVVWVVVLFVVGAFLFWYFRSQSHLKKQTSPEVPAQETPAHDG